MKRIRWTQRAFRNLREAHRFLAAENQNAANRAIETIRTSIKTLETFPEIGRPVTTIKTGLREWPIRYGSGSYIIRYRVVHDEVILLAIRHSKQNDFYP